MDSHNCITRNDAENLTIEKDNVKEDAKLEPISGELLIEFLFILSIFIP